MLQAVRWRVRDPMRWMIFSFFLILPEVLGPGVYSAYNRNEYKKQKKGLCGMERGRCLGLINLPPSVSRLYRQCGILNFSLPQRPPRPVTVTGIALLLLHSLLPTSAYTQAQCTMLSPSLQHLKLEFGSLVKLLYWSWKSVELAEKEHKGRDRYLSDPW
jgi:hypothetical protein